MTTDPLIVTHTISFNGATVDAVIGALAAKPGIKDVRAESGGRVSVAYDLRQLRFDDVEKVAAQAGAKPGGGLFNVLRRTLIRFTDENLFSSVSAPVSQCCNRPPGQK